jgi:hypothetical protein
MACTVYPDSSQCGFQIVVALRVCQDLGSVPPSHHETSHPSAAHERPERHNYVTTYAYTLRHPFPLPDDDAHLACGSMRRARNQRTLPSRLVSVTRRWDTAGLDVPAGGC